MTTYTAIARRDGRYWHVRIPGLGNRPEYGLPTQARTLAEVEPLARDLIALWLQVPADAFQVERRIELPESARRHLELAHKLSDDAAHAQADAARERREAARALKEAGFTVRDIGQALRISHQRAQQLLVS